MWLYEKLRTLLELNLEITLKPALELTLKLFFQIRLCVHKVNGEQSCFIFVRKKNISESHKFFKKLKKTERCFKKKSVS